MVMRTPAQMYVKMDMNRSIADVYTAVSEHQGQGKLIAVIRNGGAYYFFRLFLGNIAAFVPLGAYLAFRSGRSVALITLIGALSSAAIEALQFMFVVGFTEIDDVVLNTLGALLGAAAVRLIAHGTRKKKE